MSGRHSHVKHVSAVANVCVLCARFLSTCQAGTVMSNMSVRCVEVSRFPDFQEVYKHGKR